MKKIYFVLFAILCVIIFSCTDNLISTELDSHKNSSTSELRVFVKQSRLYSPVISEISWTVNLVDEENEVYSSKENGNYFLFTNLQSGTYTVNASGKDSLGVERFWGSITINFDSAKPLEVFVPVSASKNPNSDITSTGFATITMDMSDELLDILYSIGEDVILEARLLVIDDTNTDFDVYTNLTNVTYTETQELDSIDIFNNQTVNFVNFLQETKSETKDIPTGYYNLSFEGLKEFGYSIKLKDNLVEIGDGLTTNIVLTQNDYEIVENFSSILYVNNEGGETADGKTLSNPIAFSTITEKNYADLIYLLSDVEFICDENSNLSPYLDSIYVTISSFGSSLYTIKADIYNYTNTINLGGDSPITLKNVKLSGSNKFSFSNLFVDETVILDCEMDNNSTVLLSKTSNLQIGNNFSGDLYLLLNGDWKLGDTVINFENGKPENSNFYIEENCCNSEFQNYSAMFYIDDSGKLAQYDATSQWVNFAWNSGNPCLITQTQAKNKTYTRIIDSTGRYLFDFNGISTYDGNRTWYFIANGYDSSEYTVSSLYKVSASTEYTDTVIPEKIEVSIPDLTAGVNLSSITAMDYDNGKLYMGFYETERFPFYVIDTASNNSSSASVSLNHISVDKLTALLVDGDNVYMATKNPIADNSGISHSAIWQLTLELTENGYILSPAQTYTDDSGAQYPVPYYQTSSDIFEGEIDGSTFRITDLYSDGNSVYGLLANYIEKKGSDSVVDGDKNKSFMRGSVFKLEQNTSRQNNSSAPIMNATQLELRKSFPLTLENLATAKQYFILPRKIVGILNKKLVIVDDGMVPDENDCNVDRFALFDLAGEISETIDVGTSFTTQASVSSNKFFTFDPLFDAQ